MLQAERICLERIRDAAADEHGDALLALQEEALALTRPLQGLEDPPAEPPSSLETEGGGRAVEADLARIGALDSASGSADDGAAGAGCLSAANPHDTGGNLRGVRRSERRQRGAHAADSRGCVGLEPAASAGHGVAPALPAAVENETPAGFRGTQAAAQHPARAAKRRRGSRVGCGVDTGPAEPAAADSASMAEHDMLLEQLGLAQDIVGTPADALSAFGADASVSAGEGAATEAAECGGGQDHDHTAVRPHGGLQGAGIEPRGRSCPVGGAGAGAAGGGSGDGAALIEAHGWGGGAVAAQAEEADEADLDEETLALFADMDRIVDA